jgi:hypothetical protein
MKFVRLLDRHYEIFEVVNEFEDTLDVKQVTPIFGPDGRTILPASPVNVLKEDCVDDTPETLQSFVRLYIQALNTRLIQITAMQHAFISVQDHLLGRDNRQSHTP